MAQIPQQSVEIRATIVTANDQRVQVVMFPLASHNHEAPLDTLEGFLNRRRGEFFPVRLNEGAEALLPLSECYVFELTRKDEEEVIAHNPLMNRVAVNRNDADVVSYSRVSLSLKNGRRIQGSYWFYSHHPEHHRNLHDILNDLSQGKRYLVLHHRSKSLFVRIDAIARAEVRSGQDEISVSNEVVAPRDGMSETGGLVDADLGFIDVHRLEPDTGDRPSEIFARPNVGENYRFSPLANTGVFPKPKTTEQK